MSVWLIRCKVPQCLPDECSRSKMRPVHFLSVFVSISLSACVSRQWPDSFPDSLPQSPSPLTGPHKQGHSDCCKRKMYHLLVDGWQDVSAKSFYFDQKYYCNPAALFPPSPLIEQGGKRQLPLELQRKLPLQYDGKYTKRCWKMGVFVQQPGLTWLRTDWANWKWPSLMTFLASGAKGSKPPPPPSLPIKFLFDTIILQISFKGQQYRLV